MSDSPSPSMEHDKFHHSASAANEKDSTDSSDASLNKFEDAEAAPEYAHGFRLWTVMLSIFMATLIAALDLGIVATAIPGITSDFHSLDYIGWYSGTVFITVGTGAPLLGKMYKYFSGKWVYLASMFVFLIGSLIAALAPESISLIVGRAIQGLGVVGVLSGSVLMITYIAEPHLRPMLIGVWTGVLMISTVLGPPIGGAFTTGVSWRWCFWINLPIGGLMMVLVFFCFRIPKHAQPPKTPWREVLVCLDLPGFIVLTAAVVLFVQAMQWGGQSKAWSSGPVIALLTVWPILIIIFIVWEWYMGESAMIPLSHLKPRLFWTNAIYGWLLNMAEFQAIFYIPIYLQSIHGQSAIMSGVNSIPLVALLAVGSIVSGIIVSKTGYLQPLQLVSGLLSTAGAALLYTIDVNSGKARYIGPQLLLGFGIGLGNQVPMTAYQFFSTPEHVQTNTGIMLMTNGLSGAFFVTAAATIFANTMLENVVRLAPSLDSYAVLTTGANQLAEVFHGADLIAVRAGYMIGIKNVFAFSIAGCALTALLPLIIPRDRLPGHGKKAEEKVEEEGEVEPSALPVEQK